MSDQPSQPPAKPADNNLKVWVAVMLGILVFIMAARTPLDTDFWWHIRAGESSVEAGAPLLTDLFTFTRQGQAWINHSWLAEIIYFAVFREAGFLGVGLLVAVLATASMLFVYAQLEGAVLLKAAITILASTIAALVWSPRPQLFSVLLFAVVYFIIYLYKYKNKDRLWLLPVIFIFWSNLHAGFSLGFLLLAAVIAGELFNWLFSRYSESRIPWRGLRKIMLWTLACVLVVIINPNGLDTWWIPFKTVGVETLRMTIDEWASPDFHEFALQPFLWLLFAVIAAIGLSARKIDGVDLVGLIGFAYLAFLAKRNFAPFALFTAPVLARHLQIIIQNLRRDANLKPARLSWIRRLNNRYGAQSISKNLQKGINLILVAILGLIGFVKLYMVTYPTFVNSAIAEYYPVGAVDYLRQNKLSGNIFNSYAWGGYLEWELRDSLVFIDGRTDLFGDEITSEWITTIQSGEGWEETLSKWDIQYCLIEPNRPLAGALRSAGAEVLYEDQNSVLIAVTAD